MTRTKKQVELIIDPEFRGLLPSTRESFESLKERIQADGKIIHSVIYWPTEEGNVVIDGHRRLEIAEELELPYELEAKEFATREEAKRFIVALQISRRNLTKAEIAKFRAMLLEEKVAAGKSKNRAAQEVAEETSTSKRQVYRDAKLAAQLEELEPSIRKRYEAGQLDLTAKEIDLLARCDDEGQLQVVDGVLDGLYESVEAAVQVDEVDEAENEPADDEGDEQTAGDEDGEEPADDEPVYVEDIMEAEAKLLRSVAAKATALAKEIPESVWVDANHRSILKGHLKAFSDSLLQKVGKGICSLCNGQGCDFCRDSGWLPKFEFEQLEEQES